MNSGSIGGWVLGCVIGFLLGAAVVYFAVTPHHRCTDLPSLNEPCTTQVVYALEREYPYFASGQRMPPSELAKLEQDLASGQANSASSMGGSSVSPSTSPPPPIPSTANPGAPPPPSSFGNWASAATQTDTIFDVWNKLMSENTAVQPPCYQGSPWNSLFKPRLCPPMINPQAGVARHVPPSTPELMQNLRRQAWRNDDFWAEVELGERYGNASDGNYDRVEAYVWNFLASVNGRVSTDYASDEIQQAVVNARAGVTDKMSKISALLSAEERDDVRYRITYVLACRGPSGFVDLGNLFAPWSPAVGATAAQSGPIDLTPGASAFSSSAAAVTILGQNNHDALMFYKRAEIIGSGETPNSTISPIYAQYAQSYESLLRNQYGSEADAIIRSAETDAETWRRPFEYYPQGHAKSGLPLTDECAWTEDGRFDSTGFSQVSPLAVEQALWVLHFLAKPPSARLPPQSPILVQAVKEFERHEHIQETGTFNPAKVMRIIQLAAETGDPTSLIELARIHMLGLLNVESNAVEGERLLEKVAGNPRVPNFIRGMAYYDLSSVFAVGPPGVPQDQMKAQLFQQYAKNFGFNPASAGEACVLIREDEIRQNYENRDRGRPR